MSGLSALRVHRFRFARDRAIGDWAVRADTNHVGAIEIEDGAGQVGLGFFDSLFVPLPPLGWLTDYAARAVWPGIEGRTPEGLLHAVEAPRAGRRVTHPFGIGDALDNALWDLAARRVGQPLWRYLGGTAGEVDAYASGLCFNLSDADAHAFYTAARGGGHRAYKVKVGHPDVRWDLARLALVRDAVGPDAVLMADANERWDVAETRRRIAVYRHAGHALHWIEDPIARDDTAGLARLRGSLGDTRVNAGEYLGTAARLALLEAAAVDVIPLHDNITDGLRIARAAGAVGIPVTVGNTLMNIGAHLAAALPEVDYIEESRLNTTDLLAAPLPVVDGRFRLSDAPGHGLSLSPEAARDFGDAG